MIKEITQVSEEHYPLLLEADPARELVEDYVERGSVFGMEENDQWVGIMVLLPTRPETLEIVNIAVDEDHRGRGIATQLLEFAMNFAREKKVKTLEIGTGSIGFEQLYLYQKCGFRMHSIDRDFFVRHYQEEIIENGLVLRDMVRLVQDLD